MGGEWRETEVWQGKSQEKEGLEFKHKKERKWQNKEEIKIK